MSTSEIDAEIASKFGEDLQKLNSGEYDEWKADKEARLAAVILADQFTRNIFRRQAEAFSYDHLSLSIVQALSDEEILSYQALEQAFLILPFEHSENIEDQARCLSLASAALEQARAQGASEGLIAYMKTVHDYAVQHEETVRKFGRFPHRNEVLGRDSTPEELEYLLTANRYGQ